MSEMQSIKTFPHLCPPNGRPCAICRWIESRKELISIEEKGVECERIEEVGTDALAMHSVPDPTDSR